MHHQLEALVQVVQRGSVTGAAQALYVTQPALTARLNALERDVGARLLVRQPGRRAADRSGTRLSPLRGAGTAGDGRGTTRPRRARPRQVRPRRRVRVAHRVDLRAAGDPQAFLTD